MNLEMLLDELADKIATRLNGQLPKAGNSSRRLLTVEGAAEYLSRTPAAIRHLINAGTIPTVRLDGRVTIDVHDLDRVIEERKIFK